MLARAAVVAGALMVAFPAPAGAVEPFDPNAPERLQAIINSCLSNWALSGLDWTNPAEVRSVITFELDSDGRLIGNPRVLRRPRGKFAEAAPERAIAQIKNCSPFKLPASSYSIWRKITVTFDPVALKR